MVSPQMKKDVDTLKVEKVFTSFSPPLLSRTFINVPFSLSGNGILIPICDSAWEEGEEREILRGSFFESPSRVEV